MSQLKRHQEVGLSKPRWTINLNYFEALSGDMCPRPSAMMYHIVFMARRLIMVMLAFKYQEMPMLQMIAFLFTCQANLVYIVETRPYKSSLSNHLEIFNEFMILMIIDVLSTLLGYPYTQKILFSFGHMLNFMVAGILLTNFGVLIVVGFNEKKNRMRLWYKRHVNRVKSRWDYWFALREDSKPEVGQAGQGAIKIEEQSSERKPVLAENQQA